MGIPRLYSILRSQWPSVVETPSSEDTCDALFLDMSSFLHSCLSLSSTEEEMISNVDQFIRRLVVLSKPKRRVFMAFDGVPPISKLKEQFERRSKATSSSLLNPHMLTPGTAFLQAIEIAAINVAHELVQEKNDCSFDIIVSGPCVSGEGEQKIMRHIESMKGENLTNVVIYGMDADLIVMGMVFSSPGIRILRESPMSRGLPIESKEFELFSIPRFRGKIWLSYMDPTEEEMNGIMRDIGFLFTVFGNDFAPTPDGLDLSKTTLMKYVDKLRSIHRQKKFLVKNGLLQSDEVLLLFKEMAKEEQNAFKIKNPVSRSYLTTRVLELQLAGLSLQDKKSTLKTFTQQVEDERYQHWRDSYYKTTYKSVVKVKDMCEDYLKTMAWVTRYYTDGVHESWSYDNKFTPRLTDIVLHCKEIPEVNGVNIDLEQELVPLHQLAMVLPEKSKNLLPLPYQNSTDLDQLLSLRLTSPCAFHRDNVEKMVGIMRDMDDKLTDSERQRSKRGVSSRVFLSQSTNELAKRAIREDFKRI